MILKYKTHTDPEFKVNRKGVLKQMYGPPVTTTTTMTRTTTVDSNSPAALQQQQPRNSSGFESHHGDVEPTPSHASSSNSSLLLQAIAPSRPVPLRIPSHPVVVDWHHLHERLIHVKTSWLESAAHVHNPFIAAPRTSTSTARDGVIADSMTKATSDSSPPPPVGVAPGSLALFAITRLDVSENGITDLPLALFQLSSLKLLNLGTRGSNMGIKKNRTFDLDLAHFPTLKT